MTRPDQQRVPGGAAGDRRKVTRAGMPASAPGAAGGGGLVESYPARPESVAALRALLADFARRSGASPDTVASVELAVSEAATNVVLHAYRDSRDPGLIEVAAALAAGELWVIVADVGTGLRPRRDSPGLGLGLGLIAQVSDGVDLMHRAGGGLELRMRFPIDAP